MVRNFIYKICKTGRKDYIISGRSLLDHMVRGKLRKIKDFDDNKNKYNTSLSEVTSPLNKRQTTSARLSDFILETLGP